MKVSLLESLPLRDPGARILAAHPEGSPLFPGGSLASPAAVEKRIAALSNWPGNRSALQSWLVSQNPFEDLHPAQRKNLDAAKNPDALFLLTGQQPGLLGGPALWYYKAMTCAAWARRYSAQLNRPVIPVFWVAGDDSDLAECNAVEWLEAEGESSLSLEFPEPQAAIPMSLRRLAPEETPKLREALRRLGRDEAAWVEEAYAPGRSLTEGFTRLAHRFLAPEGLLFVDGFSTRALAQPLLRWIALAAPAFQQALIRGSRRLQESQAFGLQVSPRPGSVPVFALRDDLRSRLFFDEPGGRLRLYLQGSEGHDLTPELERQHLMHSALSRPLLCETVFPVLGHVLGPAELRYFAQLADVFPAFGFSMPPLAPRQQAWLCSRSEWNRLTDLGVKPGDLSEYGPSRFGPSYLRARLAEKAWQENPVAQAFPAPAFADFLATLRDYQQKLLPGPSGIDAGLRRLERAFARYRDGAQQAVYARAASATYAAFLPLLRWLGNGAQDRHVNLLSLRHRLGAEGFAGFAELLRNENAACRIVLQEGEEI